jgi:GNAT superfamily N-acetyltransferase
MLTGSTAVLAVADIVQTVTFYRDILGFHERWLWGDPPTFGCVGLDKAELFLCVQPMLAGRLDGLMHVFDVEDVDGLHARHRSTGAPIVSPLENKPWGVREYTVRDPNGYHLRFSGSILYEKPATATDTLPPYIHVHAGLPTLEEYLDLFRAVSWTVDRASMEAALDRTLAGVLATDTRDGRLVGMARATGDGRYFMVWDVIVRPSHQGQKIGFHMLTLLLDALAQHASPGSFIGLFTGKGGFYERLGFKQLFGMARGL